MTPAAGTVRGSNSGAQAAYFSELPTSVNTVLTCVPTYWTATMMKTAIKLAISAYSIAVTPDSSPRKF
jgi:hypothetical protein